MTTFQKIGLFLTAIYIVIVVVRFRRSSVVLIGGLVALGLYTVVALAYGQVTLSEIGLGSHSWLPTIGFALVWLGVMLAAQSPGGSVGVAMVPQTPNSRHLPCDTGIHRQADCRHSSSVDTRRILEELVFRGIVLRSVASLMSAWPAAPIAIAIAVCVAALGAGLMHLYQGPRATVIVTQLSVLFGILFVVSGYNLWAVILCHGMYDTVAFIRFASGKSKYSNLDRGEASSSQIPA